VLSVPVTIVANAFRIAMTGVLVAYVSPEFGQGFLHDFSGWLVYMISILLLGLTSFGLKKVHRAPPRPEPEPRSCRLESSVWPRIVIGGAIMLLAAGAGQQLLRRQAAPERVSFESFSMHLGDWRGKRFYLDQEILDELWADDYVTGNFRNESTGNVLHLLVSYYERQTTEHTAHAPTSCLLGGGWDLAAKRSLPPAPERGREFPVMQLQLQKPGLVVLSNFWFQQRGRIITSEWMNKIWLVADSLSLGRSDGALVRVELYLNPDQSLAEGQALLDSFDAMLQERLTAHIPGR
jgi:EpsI family protein